MNANVRQKLIETIINREKLRPLSRLHRLFVDPINAIPYYFFATRARLQPFLKTFDTLWGTKMTCYLPEGNTFYYYGYCEANLTNFFLRYTKEGMTCVDVGAHVGIYTMLFSELTGSKGSVHSFEPTCWTYQLLKRNTLNLENVHINNNAISESQRTLSFADYGPGYGAYNSAHSDGAPALAQEPKMTQVTSVSLDTYCTQHNISPDIIKIDSEGFEFEVLQGSKNLLKPGAQNRPIVTIEVANGDDWAENRNASFALLTEYQYKPFTITKEGLLTKHLGTESYDYDNILFVPTEKISELSKLSL